MWYNTQYGNMCIYADIPAAGKKPASSSTALRQVGLTLWMEMHCVVQAKRGKRSPRNGGTVGVAHGKLGYMCTLVLKGNLRRINNRISKVTWAQSYEKPSEEHETRGGAASRWSRSWYAMCHSTGSTEGSKGAARSVSTGSVCTVGIFCYGAAPWLGCKYVCCIELTFKIPGL